MARRNNDSKRRDPRTWDKWEGAKCLVTVLPSRNEQKPKKGRKLAERKNGTSDKLVSVFMEHFRCDHCKHAMFAVGSKNFQTSISDRSGPEMIVMVGSPAFRGGFIHHDTINVNKLHGQAACSSFLGNYIIGKDSVSCASEVSTAMPVSEEKAFDAVDFSELENLEYHFNPNMGQKVDIRGLEPDLGINAGPTSWRSLGQFAILSNGGFAEPASKGLLKDALYWIVELEKSTLETTADDLSVWNQLGIEQKDFDQFIHELREHAVMLASIYMTTHSPLDNPIFSSCAQELLVEIPYLQATNILRSYCTMVELQHWSNDLPPLRIALSVVNVKQELALYDFSKELRAVLMAAVVYHFLDQNKMPIVSERQFMRWSRVVSSIFIFELQQEFKLAIKQGDDGRHRLILEVIT